MRLGIIPPLSLIHICRAVNNPGKYERYKPFTGLDEPVIRFLEDDGEIAVFLEHAYAPVSYTHLDVYKRQTQFPSGRPKVDMRACGSLLGTDVCKR